jgi:hypothetical protein
VVAAEAAAAVPAAAAAAVSASAEVAQQWWDGSVIVMCSIAITMICGGSDWNDSKTLTQWDLTFVVQS